MSLSPRYYIAHARLTLKRSRGRYSKTIREQKFRMYCFMKREILAATFPTPVITVQAEAHYA